MSLLWQDKLENVSIFENPGYILSNERLTVTLGNYLRNHATACLSAWVCTVCCCWSYEEENPCKKFPEVEFMNANFQKILGFLPNDIHGHVFPLDICPAIDFSSPGCRPRISSAVESKIMY